MTILIDHRMLVAMTLAFACGTDAGKPRNLVKSVLMEQGVPSPDD